MNKSIFSLASETHYWNFSKESNEIQSISSLCLLFKNCFWISVFVSLSQNDSAEPYWSGIIIIEKIIQKRSSVIQITIWVAPSFLPFPIVSLFMLIKEQSWVLSLIVSPSLAIEFISIPLKSVILVVIIWTLSSFLSGLWTLPSFLSGLKLPIPIKVTLVMHSIRRFLLIVYFWWMRVPILRFPKFMIRHWPIFVKKTVEVRTFFSRFLMLLFNYTLHFL